MIRFEAKNGEAFLARASGGRPDADLCKGGALYPMPFMKTLDAVLALAGLAFLAPSPSLLASEHGVCACEASETRDDTASATRGGKSSRGHAQARAAKAEADQAAEQRAARRAEEKARKIAAGETPVTSAPVAVAPVKASSGGGKASSAHARAKAAKASADQAAAAAE